MTGRPPVGRIGSRRGVVLPAALLLLLGSTLMGASLLVIARSAVVLADGDRRLAAALARRGPALALDGPGTTSYPLGHGYVIVGAQVTGVEWAPWRVVWRAEPARIAGALRAVVESGSGVPEGSAGVGAASAAEGCPDLEPLPAQATPRSPVPPAAQPALPAFPRLGPVGTGDLLERAGEALRPGEELPAGQALVATEPGAAVSGGTGGGILVAPGDLTLSGSTHFEGLVMVAGDLRLQEEARIHGAVLAAGAVRLGPEARIVGCRALVQERLAGLASLEPPFHVPGGGFLGRH